MGTSFSLHGNNWSDIKDKQATVPESNLNSDQETGVRIEVKDYRKGIPTQSSATGFANCQHLLDNTIAKPVENATSLISQTSVEDESDMKLPAKNVRPSHTTHNLITIDDTST